MKTPSHKSLLLAAGLVVASLIVSVVATPVTAKTPTEEEQRKADYIFMEALRQNTAGNRDAYYYLLQRALDLNPAETAIGTDLGFYEVALYAGKDSTMTADGLSKMKAHFDLHPEDYYSSVSYGSIVGRMGLIDEAQRVWGTLDSIFPDKHDVALNYAQALAASDDSTSIRRSLEIYDRLERKLGMSMVLSGNRVASYMALGDTASAAREMDRLAASSPNDITPVLAAGDFNMMIQRPDTAIIYFDRACALDSTSGQAIYKRALYYQAVGDTSRYESEIVNAVSKNNLDLDVKLEFLRAYLSEVYADSLKRPVVEGVFASLIDNHPHEEGVHRLYASYLVAVNDFAQAAEQQSYALDINPNDSEGWIGLISLYARASDVAGQIQAGKRAMRYYPDNAEIVLYSSMAYLQADSTAQALSLSRRALSLAEANDSIDHEQLSSIISSVGDVYYKLDQPDSAFVYYDRALEAWPDNLLALNNCAYYYACQDRDLDKAEEMITRVIAAQPDSPTSLDTYAWVLFKQYKYETAREFIDKAIELETDPSAELFDHAGDIYFMLRLPDEALDFWKKASALDPDNELIKRKIQNRAYYSK